MFSGADGCERRHSCLGVVWKPFGSRFMASLFEQYRPASWAEVVGQDKALAKIETLRKRGLGGRAWLITGQSGTGKTTIARLLAGEVADEWQTHEYADPSEL